MLLLTICLMYRTSQSFHPMSADGGFEGGNDGMFVTARAQFSGTAREDPQPGPGLLKANMSAAQKKSTALDTWMTSSLAAEGAQQAHQGNDQDLNAYRTCNRDESE